MNRKEPYIEATAAQKAAFLRAMEAQSRPQAAQSGIGTLAEKSLHRILKYYLEPLPELHERKIGSFYADIFNENGIIEVQTGAFFPLQKKLATFLPLTAVTVVHPLWYEKTLITLDPQSGEVLSEKRSPRHETVYDCAKELYWLRSFLNQPNLTLRFLYLSGKEYRMVKNRSGGRAEYQTVSLAPEELLGEQTLHTREQYCALIPMSYGEKFTVLQLREKIGGQQKRLRPLLYALQHAGFCGECGKDGRKKLYVMQKES